MLHFCVHQRISCVVYCYSLFLTNNTHCPAHHFNDYFPGLAGLPVD